MAIQVSGKHFNLGEALRTHIVDKIETAVSKYFDGAAQGLVVVDHEGSGYRSDCTLHLSSGVTLHCEGRAQEPYASFDQAADRLEKRLRRYKRRLKEHPVNQQAAVGSSRLSMTSYVVQPPDEDTEEAAEYNPVIIAEHISSLPTMPVATAVMEIDMTGAPVVVFRNAGSHRINVVYKRSDGNIGWVDPAANENK